MSPVFIFFSSAAIRRSRLSRSASISSVSTVSASDTIDPPRRQGTALFRNRAARDRASIRGANRGTDCQSFALRPPGPSPAMSRSDPRRPIRADWRSPQPVQRSSARHRSPDIRSTVARVVDACAVAGCVKALNAPTCRHWASRQYHLSPSASYPQAWDRRPLLCVSRAKRLRTQPRHRTHIGRRFAMASSSGVSHCSRLRKSRRTWSARAVQRRTSHPDPQRDGSLARHHVNERKPVMAGSLPPTFARILPGTRSTCMHPHDESGGSWR